MNAEALIVAGEASESDEELYSPVPSRYAKYIIHHSLTKYRVSQEKALVSVQRPITEV